MHASALAIVAAARGCVGTRFRPQGRTPGVALDCIGVVLIAARGGGVSFVVPPYRLGGDGEAALDAGLATQGCVAIERAAPGDILVIAPAPGRRHLGVVTERGVVHAHAGLGRVVEGPLDPDWAVVGAWQLPAQSQE
ncbi:peptidoglycan endopeptidase [Glacieibacterium frigidum]|uniref:Peptidoglycan endopeptidase n=1 Tax=Glacieibacterium frigidum TaxID=2593303 RepID=A0A552U818_9SPHN|nr:peptidoglycan endopeptidase [Glacieibacterium frigidum]TRW14351.1 peptidoglycan endopeptidase [Glacieibacterium frigidum]